ncbi:FHA domain-containing protein [Aggregatilineales bacterium SYSU G02658]
MTEPLQVQIMVMSGVDDGTLHTFDARYDGQPLNDSWTLTIGRRDDNDLCLRGDVFVSRQHANLIWRGAQWYLQDIHSTNGTFIENHNDLFADERVSGTVPLCAGQLFRIGRTWLRLQPLE